MEVTKQDFLNAVIHEVEQLKIYTTDEEKNMLNYNRLEPKNRYKCIYGMATGSCFSVRASDLILECT